MSAEVRRRVIGWVEAVTGLEPGEVDISARGRLRRAGWFRNRGVYGFPGRAEYLWLRNFLRWRGL